MKSKYKIAWQKYEDVLEKQLSSPIITQFIKNIINSSSNQNANNDPEENLTFDDDDDDNNEDNYALKNLLMVPLSENMIQELSVMSNFDCWIAHTNFDVTMGIKDKLNIIPGVEVLKIFSRYRFFVGVGKLFDFTEVRKNIENEIIPKEI